MERTKLIFWTMVVLGVTALLVAGCGGPSTPTPEAGREPFTARRESGDGAIVAWSGYTQGYEPGVEATFRLTITNQTGQSWHGRYCFHLMSGDSHQIIATLEQREFTLEPGVGFSDAMEVEFPEALDPGAYGLSLAVRRSAGPMVELVPIQVGDTDEVRRAATQQDLDASLAACPPVEGTAQELVELATADLAQRLGISPDEIEVQGVEPTEFPDASLGVPEPGEDYAQVVTPGTVIELVAQGELYRYHGADGRVVFASGDAD
ncbi:MAG: hypothetical protein PVI59_15110 [Anaerolineae bacterium]|jgi:hypothetical protein